jgi:hypothetical protein
MPYPDEKTHFVALGALQAAKRRNTFALEQHKLLQSLNPIRPHQTEV